jgi:predicted nucleic acid-binding Zn ribbon protein
MHCIVCGTTLTEHLGTACARCRLEIPRGGVAQVQFCFTCGKPFSPLDCNAISHRACLGNFLRSKEQLDGTTDTLAQATTTRTH